MRVGRVVYLMLVFTMSLWTQHIVQPLSSGMHGVVCRRYVPALNISTVFFPVEIIGMILAAYTC